MYDSEMFHDGGFDGKLGTRKLIMKVCNLDQTGCIHSEILKMVPYSLVWETMQRSESVTILRIASVIGGLFLLLLVVLGTVVLNRHGEDISKAFRN